MKVALRKSGAGKWGGLEYPHHSLSLAAVPRVKTRATLGLTCLEAKPAEHRPAEPLVDSHMRRKPSSTYTSKLGLLCYTASVHQ